MLFKAGKQKNTMVFVRKEHEGEKGLCNVYQVK
jgi:hypothetical protein